MRGKEDFWSVSYQSSGITPAYAGKSRTDSGPVPGPKDHPRVCGEKEGNGMKFDVELGSPPRMRGKDPNWTPDQATPRITPAYAGKRCGARLAAGHRRDHPRVCGEKTLWQNPRWKIPGSPPRMRGKVGFTSATEGTYGITPAYAGKSILYLLIGQCVKDPPRVCGEKPVVRDSAG